MNESQFDTLIRKLTDISITRRGITGGLAGAAIAAGISHVTLDDADAKRRGGKKGKSNSKKGKGKKRRGGNGGGERCRFDRCEGRCVDLDTDSNNCGACGDTCPQDAICVGGRCAFALGTRGSGNQQFDAPAGVAISNSGNDGFAFAADTNNHRIAVFAGAVAFDTFGQFGDRDGQFLRPTGVGIGAPHIFVTDIDRHRIQRFSLDGDFEVGSGSFGSGIGQFNAPHGIAVNIRTGQVNVADTGNHSVQRLNFNLGALDRIGRQGSGAGEFNFPKGIALDREENLVIADTGNNRVQVIDPDGNVIRTFGREGAGNGEFTTPIAIAIDRKTGDIFVVDQGNNRVQQFSSEGQFRKAFGRGGTGVGEFDSPFGIAIDNRDVITVVDQGNDRVQFFFPASLATESLGRELRARQQQARQGRKGGQK